MYLHPLSQLRTSIYTVPGPACRYPALSVPELADYRRLDYAEIDSNGNCLWPSAQQYIAPVAAVAPCYTRMANVASVVAVGALNWQTPPNIECSDLPTLIQT